MSERAHLHYVTGYGFCLSMNGEKHPLNLNDDGPRNEDKQRLLDAWNEREERVAELEAERERLIRVANKDLDPRHLYAKLRGVVVAIGESHSETHTLWKVMQGLQDFADYLERRALPGGDDE